jgi:hypothetical protein
MKAVRSFVNSSGPRRKKMRSRITVTSSLIEISTDQLGIRVVVGRRFSAHLHPFLQQASGQIFEDDVTVFPPPKIFAS